MRRMLALAGLFALLATPAAADPNCLTTGGPGLHVELGFHVGEKYTESEQEELDKIRLRQAGIIADTVERTWLGCWKITRRTGSGWITEYYDPRTLKPMPLNLRLP